MNYNLKQLRRLRWIVTAAVIAGIGASIAMNVLHAPDTLTARLVSAGPPLAVFGALELISRIPSSSRGLSFWRIAGAGVIASGAAAISYAQQRAAVMGLGFAEWEAWIWPLIIDGLMVVASISLVEVVRLIRNLVNGGEALMQMSPARQVQVEESAEVLAYRAAMAKRRTDGVLAGLSKKA